MPAITLPQDPISYDGASFTGTAEAAIALAYACVKCGTADGTYIETAAASDPGVGFIRQLGAVGAGAALVTPIAIGDLIEIFYDGCIVWAVASAAIAKNVLVSATTGGKVVTTAGAVRYVGISLGAAGANNEIIPVMVKIGSAT